MFYLVLRLLKHTRLKSLILSKLNYMIIMFTPSPSEPSSFQNLPKMQFIRAIFSSGTTLGRKKNYFFHAASSNNNALLQSHRGCDFCHKIRASLSSVLISIQQVALLAMELKPKHLKNCEFCPGSQFIVFMLIVRALNWQYHKVNRCPARYSPRSTTTNRPTNRAPNKPACPGPN